MEYDVYIAGSLRHSPKEWWKFYERIAETIESVGLKAYVPHVQTIERMNQSVETIHDPNVSMDIRADAYKKNIEMVEGCRIIVAELTRLSVGTGVELGFALKMGKPIICLAKRGVDVTSMILGPAHMKMAKMIRYDTEEEAFEGLKQALKEYLNS